ncbi:MAG: hypothetical protein L0I66_07970 [Tetragenococcus halophilus]|nr:hypothetical protein [Tetragenococcus halophilus]
MANVLLDMDNTLTRVDVILDKMSNVFQKDIISADKLESFKLAKAFGVTEEQEKFFWEHYGYEVIEKSEPNEKVIESLFKNVIKSDDKVYVITARPESQRKITEDWISRFQIPHSDLILTGNHSKIQHIENLMLDTIIDDNPTLFGEIESIPKVFPNSFISQIVKDKTIKRYAVDFNYNKDSLVEYRINRDTGEIKNGINQAQ